MYSFLRSPSFSFKQDRQCKHNVILWCVRVTSVAVAKQECALYVWLSYMSQQHENRGLHKSVLRQIYVLGNDNTHSHPHVKFPIFLPESIQICILSTDFDKSPQCQTSRKSVHWEPH